MAQQNIFDLPELLEQILYFLEIDQSLYSALFVNRLWYHCGAPILWRRIDPSNHNKYVIEFRFRIRRKNVKKNLINHEISTMSKLTPLIYLLQSNGSTAYVWKPPLFNQLL